MTMGAMAASGRRRLMIGMIGMMFVSVPMPHGWAEEKWETPQSDQQSEDLVVTNQGGTRFLSLRDWPARHEQNGVVRPVPLEEYLSMKFGQVRKHSDAFDQRVKLLEDRLQQLEQEHATMRQQLQVLQQGASRSQEQAQGGPDSHTAQNQQSR